MIGQCQKHRVEINLPADQDSYNKQIDKVLDEKNKAINLLFDDIVDEIAK